MSSSANPKSEDKSLFNEAYESAFSSAQLSKKQERIDKYEDQVADRSGVQFGAAFTQDNQDTLGTSVSGLGQILSTESKSIEDAIDNFSEKAAVVIKGLDDLSKLHPFIGVAVIAFKLVVTLELKRRDNNRKVLAVKVQMQDMVCELFRLRNVKDPEIIAPNGTRLNSLQELMKNIAEDIRKCGSACDVYMNKTFIRKLLKAPFYESRLATFGTLFQEYREKVASMLSIHTTLGVDRLNEMADKQSEHMRIISQKLDMLLVFRDLDTPREIEVTKFIETNGGAKACVDKDDLLDSLVKLSSDSMGGSSGGKPLAVTRNELLQELAEDVDEIMKKNLVLFERKLDIQSERIADAVQFQGRTIIKAFSAGAHEYIRNPHLRTIWQVMNWKASVKARHFVLALRDYFTDQFLDDNTTNVTQYHHFYFQHLSEGVSPTSDIIAQGHKVDDRWALSYINVGYLEPILEAIDDDGSGFINIKEANTFALSCPPDWSLLQWVAYWAAEMFGLLDEVLPDNRKLVDEYLDHWSFVQLEHLLHSTKLVDNTIRQNQDLVNFAETFAKAEEDRLEHNIQRVSYNIDSPNTVSLVTGPGRIERYIYPLLFLLLKQHLLVIAASRKHILNIREFYAANTSMTSIFEVFGERLQHLQANFKQMHLDLKTQLESFAFGMFLTTFHGVEAVPSEDTFLTYTDPVTSYESSLLVDEADKSSRLGVEDDFYFELYNSPKFPEPSSEERARSLMEGSWTGLFYQVDIPGRRKIASEGLMNFSIFPTQGPHFEGEGEYFKGLFTVRGFHTSSEKDVQFTLEFNNGNLLQCSGLIDTDNNVINGHWNNGQDFMFCCRTPSDFWRYNYTMEEFTENPARARWSFLRSAIRHLVQRQMWSWSYFKTRFAERRRYLDLCFRTMTKSIFPLRYHLSPEEEDEWIKIGLTWNPADTRLYHTLMEDKFFRLPYRLGAVSCVMCADPIVEARFICITCVEDRLIDNVDLCTNCRDFGISWEEFNHFASHSLIRTDLYIHESQRKIIYANAKNISTSLKIALRVYSSPTSFYSVPVIPAPKSSIEGISNGPSRQTSMLHLPPETDDPPLATLPTQATSTPPPELPQSQPLEDESHQYIDNERNGMISPRLIALPDSTGSRVSFTVFSIDCHNTRLGRNLLLYGSSLYILQKICVCAVLGVRYLSGCVPIMIKFTPYIIVCDDCDFKRPKSLPEECPSTHNISHLLMRISSTDEDTTNYPQLPPPALDFRFGQLALKVDTLDQKIDERFNELENVINNRLSTLEDLVQKFISDSGRGNNPR